MTDWITASLLLIGASLSAVAALGVVRMPDLFTRMQAASKAGTLGVGCILLAVAVHFGDVGITTRALLVTGFLLLTAPVAGHAIARAAYHAGVPLWERTVRDELREHLEADAAGAPPQDPTPEADASRETGD